MRTITRYIQDTDPASDPTIMSVFDEWWSPATMVKREWDGTQWQTVSAGETIRVATVIES